MNLLPAAAIICLLLVLMEHMGEFYACFLRQGARPYMALIALTTWPILATLAWLGMRTVAAWILHRKVDLPIPHGIALPIRQSHNELNRLSHFDFAIGLGIQ